MYLEVQSFAALRRNTANDIVAGWAEKLKFPAPLQAFVKESLDSDVSSGLGAAAFRSIRNWVSGFTHRVPHWTELERSCVEDLGRRMQHLLTVHTADRRLCGAVERHLSELFIAYGRVLNAYASQQGIEECTFSLLRLRELLTRHYAEQLRAAEKDFERNFFRAQLETQSTAPEFIGRILRAATAEPGRYELLQRNLVDFLKRNGITALYGIAMGGGGLAGCIAEMARQGGFESKLPLGAPCGVLIPTKRKRTEQKFYGLDGKLLVVRPGPAIPERFSAVPALPREGKVLVIDDVLTKGSKTRAALTAAFGRRLGPGGAIFAAGDGSRFSEGADLSLFEIFLSTGTRAEAGERDGYLSETISRNK